MRHKSLLYFQIQTDHLILARQPDLVIVNKKKENLPNFGLCCSGWPQSTIERKRKEGLVHDLGRELKKLWNIKVSFIPIIIGAFGTVIKGFLKELEDLEKKYDKRRPSKLLNYWDQPEYWELAKRIKEMWCLSNFSEISSANTDVKNSQGVK